MSESYSFKLGVCPGWHITTKQAIDAYLKKSLRPEDISRVSFLIENAIGFKISYLNNIYMDTSSKRSGGSWSMTGKEKRETAIIAKLDQTKAVEYRLKYSQSHIDTTRRV